MATTTLSARPRPLTPQEIDHLGILAGEGAFPVLIARAARDHGITVTVFGLKGITSPELEQIAHHIHWMELGQFERLIQLFHENGITKMVMAGRVKHNSIFQLARIDRRGLKLMGRMATMKADSILGAVTQELATENIEVLDSTIFLRSLMPPKGLLTPRARPGKEVMRDVDFGYDHAKSIAALDIGQTVVVKGLSVVAVEAMEGTNAAIRRAGEIAGPGVVVVKVSKPRQDRRFDVPVLGLQTVRHLVESKAAALAFSGGETLFFDQPEAIALAEAHKISLLGV